jgi:hypothetical protein
MPEQAIQQHPLEPWLDLEPHLEGLHVISLGLGPDGALYVLAIVPPLDYKEEQPGWAIFQKIRPDRPNTFVVLQCQGRTVNRIEISNQSWTFHHVQPLPGDEILLVCARSMYRGPDDFDANGHVFNLAGIFQRAFLLGDGIQDVQTTLDGRIWVSYFDEGIFGNDPIGASGLVCWDQSERKVYEYSPPNWLRKLYEDPPDGEGYILDCYALNVANDQDTWCYYYSDFPLVHIRDYQVAEAWKCPIRGSDGFVVDQEMVLMSGGYNEEHVHHLLALQPGGRIHERVRYTLTDEENVPLPAYPVALRASTMVILNGTRCYRITMADLLSHRAQSAEGGGS